MSGIYIPMEMPRKTGVVNIVLSGDGSALLCEDGVYSEIQAIPVPDHGRLIDGDALREDWLENGENEYVYDANSFLDSLDDAPTIIPADLPVMYYPQVDGITPTIIPASGGDAE